MFHRTAGDSTNTTIRTRRKNKVLTSEQPTRISASETFPVWTSFQTNPCPSLLSWCLNRFRRRRRRRRWFRISFFLSPILRHGSAILTVLSCWVFPSLKIRVVRSKIPPIHRSAFSIAETFGRVRESRLNSAFKTDVYGGINNTWKVPNCISSCQQHLTSHLMVRFNLFYVPLQLLAHNKSPDPGYSITTAIMTTQMVLSLPLVLQGL